MLFQCALSENLISALLMFNVKDIKTEDFHESLVPGHMRFNWGLAFHNVNLLQFLKDIKHLD